MKTPEAVFSWAVSSRTTGNDTPIADVVVRNSVSITLDGGWTNPSGEEHYEKCHEKNATQILETVTNCRCLIASVETK